MAENEIAATGPVAPENPLHPLGGRYALCTMRIGVGQGIAVVLERV